MAHTLREDIDARHLLEDVLESRRRPYSRREILILFGGLVHAVQAMHNAGYSHRDITPMNVMISKQGKSRSL
eukprot:873256-Ditylum_brightwellii.AAC.1